MKKLLSLLLALVMVFALTACGQQTAPAEKTADVPTNVPADAPDEIPADAPDDVPADAPDDVPADEPVEADPMTEPQDADTLSYTSEPVSFDDGDDSSVYGVMYYPADFDPSKEYPVVIASHGFGVTSLFFEISGWAPALASEGYVVYAFDFHGGAPDEGGMAGVSQSSGNWMDMSIPDEVETLNHVVEFIKMEEFTETNQIYLLGQSQGGCVTALTAAEREVDGKNDIAGVILLYPYLNVAGDVREKYPTWESLPTEDGADEWLETPIGVKYLQDIYNLDIYETIAGFNGKLLVVQGMADTTVPCDTALKAMNECYAEQSAELVLVAGTMSGHSFEMYYPEGKDMAFTAVLSTMSAWTASSINDK